MADLFTLTELASYLQQDIDTATATLLRDLATAEVRAAVGQTLTAVADDEVAIPVNPYGVTVVLPQRPVTAVDAVEVDGAAITDWEWDGVETVTREQTWGVTSVTVTYDHGSDDAAYLGAAKSVALAVAARAYVNPGQVRQETIDDYSRSMDTPPGVGLLPDEVRRLRRAYGRSAFSVVLQ